MPRWSPLRPWEETSQQASDAELRDAVDGLLALLRAERARLRPDVHALAWSLTTTCGEYRRAWPRLRGARPAECAELIALLTHRLRPALEDFLALPDSQKPAHADALHEELARLRDERLGPLQRRLTRALTATSRARREL